MGGVSASVLAEALRELHYPEKVTGTGGRVQLRPDGTEWETCAHCDTGDPYVTTSSDWPCPTEKIIREVAG